MHPQILVLLVLEFEEILLHIPVCTMLAIGFDPLAMLVLLERRSIPLWLLAGAGVNRIFFFVCVAAVVNIIGTFSIIISSVSFINIFSRRQTTRRFFIGIARSGTTMFGRVSIFDILLPLCSF